MTQLLVEALQFRDSLGLGCDCIVVRGFKRRMLPRRRLRHRHTASRPTRCSQTALAEQSLGARGAVIGISREYGDGRLILLSDRSSFRNSRLKLSEMLQSPPSKHGRLAQAP